MPACNMFHSCSHSFDLFIIPRLGNTAPHFFCRVITSRPKRTFHVSALQMTSLLFIRWPMIISFFFFVMEYQLTHVPVNLWISVSLKGSILWEPYRSLYSSLSYPRQKVSSWDRHAVCVFVCVCVSFQRLKSLTVMHEIWLNVLLPEATDLVLFHFL